jgi:phosphopantothenoylcysteine decarboxylase/phosphopantothenate--cysteine ligase
VTDYAARKLKSKNADWIVANDVSPETRIMGGDRNRVHLVTAHGVDDWPEMSKEDVAATLIERICQHLRSHEDAAE